MSEFRRVYRTELSPVSFLTRSAYVFPDKTAVVHGSRRYTYRQLEERVNRLASALRAAGLAKHDRVAFLCPNIPPMLEAHYGVPAAGGVLVAINTRLNSDEIAYILEHSVAKFLFVDAELEPLVKPLPLSGLRVVRIDDSGAPGDPYEDFLAGGSPSPVESWLEDEEEMLAINYTSGTTGRPKGVMYSHRGAWINALGEVLESQMSFDARYLWTLPMFHCNGWCFTWGVTAVGGTHICLRRVEPGRVWDMIDKEGVTHYNGAPTVHIGVVNDPKAHKLARPVTVCVAGAPPSPTLLGRLKELGFRPVHVYGLTETYGPHTVCAWHEEWDALPLDDRGRAVRRPPSGRARVRGGRGPGRQVGRAAQGLRHAQARADGDRAGDHRVLSPAHRALQVPRRGRVRRPAEDVDRQGTEVRASREGVEGPGEADQLDAPARCARPITRAKRRRRGGRHPRDARARRAL